MISPLKKTIFYLLPLFVCVIPLFGQTEKMKPLRELINTKEPGWVNVQKMMSEAKNEFEVLPKDSVRADSALFHTQVTTRSAMGAVVYETGGILIDHGWIRILGSGSNRLNRDLMEWNKGKSFKNYGERPSFLLIADDVIGGFYAINAGGIDSTGIGKVFYFAPDNLKWEPMNYTYTEFLWFCFNGDLKKYYKNVRWKKWKKEVSKLDGNSGMSFFPHLWSEEGQKNINKTRRTVVPIQELWDQYFRK